MSQAARIMKLQQERWEYEKGMADTLVLLAEAHSVLEWYANEMNWTQGRYEGGLFFTVAEDDQGNRARNLLAKHDKQM
ncbi:hypothetical protein DFQ01_103211 [Paenibacillus cellulosilyticus]|uniref:Uncharacterized protein n=1 Tax=Paenibacillus cellulosilyticus TaxID=375489 RepID=A0A2V2Z137_9BACL|nr:hypothetical protein [Paenibacillus cellulosilyticus]PWW06309.1 hypothetical protein DFQ01_103211 [Paenibacillus cellulosilyticus]QKS42946.1 hypothetical protein HUB94_00140 [Paenibacillus cellulosilyticus]QKS43469.1 hypothetical protein HUB94_02805 [Paenibacillus cellulosilyticus]QKS46330.1 hypothetical protein HUB94_19170 [Paenibacillus cellulosilyticus]